MTRIGFSSFKLACIFAAGIFATTASPYSASAQIGIYIGRTPPPMRYEARPLAPGPGYSWIDGFYEPWQGGYRWHRGYWNQPPYAGAYWQHPHYDHYPEGWHFHEGYWGHEDHDDHHSDKRDRKDERKDERKDDRKDERKDDRHEGHHDDDH